MIQKLNLLHYLSEDTYKKICVKLGFDDSNAKENIIAYKNEKISKINMFNIKYKQFGHICFMDVEVDFPKFNCDYDTFEEKLSTFYLRIRAQHEFYLVFNQDCERTLVSFAITFFYDNKWRLK